MMQTRIALVRREVDELLQKERFLAAADSVDGNLSRGGASSAAEPAARRELLIAIHREAVKAGSEDAKSLRFRFGDELSGPFGDFLERVAPDDPSIVNRFGFDDEPTLTGEALARVSNS